MTTAFTSAMPLTVIDATDGIALIPSPAALQRANWFDGKFLRADDLQAEQEYLRRLAQIAGLVGGGGLVDGFDVALAGASLRIGPGLALDDLGRPLLLPSETEVDVDRLVALARGDLLGADPSDPATPSGLGAFGACIEPAPTVGSGTVVPSSDWWVITIGYGEALCGEEDVFGRLCEDACATSTDRPFRVEGVVVRAEPLALAEPLITSSAVPFTSTHLRSRLTSAIFADERRRATDLRSRAGLRSIAWCQGARLTARPHLPIALLIRSGATNVRVDAWAVRRERIDVPPARHWDGPLGLRPWNVFLAQVLQFQCQLRDLPDATGPVSEDEDPCRDKGAALGHAVRLVDELADAFAREDDPPLLRLLGVERFSQVRAALASASQAGAPVERALLAHGIVELPPAGLLPVEPASVVAVEDQVDRLLGPGVDLRFLTARPDVLAQVFAESQHLDRISLVTGLDDPTAKVPVDVYVPDGVIEAASAPPTAAMFDTTVRLLPLEPGGIARADEGVELGTDRPAATATLRGITTIDVTRGLSLSFAGGGELARTVGVGFVTRAGAAEQPDDAPPLNIRRTADRLVGDDLARRAGLRLNALAAEARRFSARTEAPDRRPGAFAPALEPNESRQLAAWLEVDIAGDLRSVAAGDTVPIDGRVVASSPARSTVVRSDTVGGRLTIEQAVAIGGGRRRVTGRADHVVFDEILVRDGGQPESSRFELIAEVQLTLVLTTTSVSSVDLVLSIRIRDAEQSPRQVLHLQAELGGDPLRIGASLTQTLEKAASLAARGPTADLPLAKARLQLDPAVAQPGNEANQIARAAIDVVAAGIGEPALADRARARLFPEGQAPEVAQHVRATRDWVLFQHRADRTPAATRPAPVPRPPRTYEVYVASAPGRAGADEIAAILRSGDTAALRRLDIRAVDRVTFDGTDLRSSASELLDAWRAASPGPDIVVAAIAVHGAPESQSLELGRGQRVAEVVSPVSNLDAAATSIVLAGVPPELEVAGVDGVMLLVTIPQERITTCIDVRRWDGPGRERADVFDRDALVRLVAAATPLGEVRFDGIDVVAGLDEVVAAWQAAGGGGVRLPAAFARTGDDEAGTEVERAARTAAIIEALGGAGAAQTAFVDQDLDAGCPVVLLVAAGSGQEPPPIERAPGHELWAVAGAHGSWRDDLEPRLADGIVDRAALEQLEAEGHATRLGFMVFKRGTTDLGGPSTTRNRADAGGQFATATPRETVSLFDPAHFTDIADVVTKQAVKLAGEAGAQVQQARLIEVPRPPLDSREVLTILVLEMD